jgi:nicotinamide-nucleotide amidase
MTIDPALLREAESLLQALRERGLMLATAESCTGGLVAASLAGIAGASDVLERGFVTYTNAAKHEMLGVQTEIFERYGAVSEPCARAMAEGALAHSRAQVTIAVTGIAGPGGGSAEKPVGLVHFAAARSGGPVLHRERRFGNVGRLEIQRLAVLEAFELIAEAAGVTGMA